MDIERIDINDIEQKIAEMEGAFNEIQMPRPRYVLENFVLGAHDTEPRQYSQCVLELQNKYDAIRGALLHKRKIQIEIEKLQDEMQELDDVRDKELKQIEIDMKRINIEKQDRAMIGAVREFEILYDLWQSFPHHYTREELDAAQPEYWNKRLTRQAHQDVQATGRVSVGNQEALRQIGKAPVPELDHVRDVERKYLETGDVKVLIVVPTIEKAVDGIPCINKLHIPSGVQVKIYNVWGRAIDDAYNDAAMTLLRDGADFMLTVEDDTFPPPDALVRLLDHMRGNNDKIIVGAWYPKRSLTDEGTPIVVERGKRRDLKADGEVHEVYTIPMGCTLFPKEAFLQTDQPWFSTTAHLSQDSFFSQKARDAGWTLLCDTAIRCEHIDRDTGTRHGTQFANIAGYNKILVSGPQRSGTRLVAHAIAHDTGHFYIDEGSFDTFSRKKFEQILERNDRVVIQCPTMTRWLHEYADEDTLIVMVKRDIDDIIASQEKIGWTEIYEKGELANYDEDEGPISKVKYEFWEEEQKDKVPHWIEVEYESLKDHPLWVSKEERDENWGPHSWQKD